MLNSIWQVEYYSCPRVLSKHLRFLSQVQTNSSWPNVWAPDFPKNPIWLSDARKISPSVMFHAESLVQPLCKPCSLRNIPGCVYFEFPTEFIPSHSLKIPIRIGKYILHLPSVQCSRNHLSGFTLERCISIPSRSVYQLIKALLLLERNVVTSTVIFLGIFWYCNMGVLAK